VASALLENIDLAVKASWNKYLLDPFISYKENCEEEGRKTQNEIRLCHPPDSVTSPNNEQLCFLTTIISLTKSKMH